MHHYWHFFRVFKKKTNTTKPTRIMINADSWFSVIWWYRPSLETQTIFKYPSQKSNTWHTHLENSVVESSYPRQRKADAATIKCSGLTDIKLPGFYSHHHASLWEEKFSNPMHIAAGGREAVYELFHGFLLCMLTENLLARTQTVVVLSARLLIYTQERRVLRWLSNPRTQIISVLQ